MKIILTTIILTISLNNHAFLGRLMEKAAGGPKELPNCDSELIKENKYDKEFSDNYWMGQLNKAVKKNDYCRQAQLWWHFYMVMPKFYTENQGHEKTIEALYKGSFFFELQWQIKNFRKEKYKGYKESVDYMQVSSYWQHLEAQAKRDNGDRCLNTKGYYEDPISGKRFTLLEEAFMSTNDFIKRYPESKNLKEVEEAREYIKDLNGRFQLCSAKSSLKHMENPSRKGKTGPENYWSIYTRLAQILANYQNSQAIEESLYLMATIIKKLEKSTSARDKSPVDESFDFLYQENWNSKFDQLADILVSEYSSSPWTQKLLTEFH